MTQVTGNQVRKVQRYSAFARGTCTFAIAGIIYLASWIVQVGFGVSEEVEELRRDADLVV